MKKLTKKQREHAYEISRKASDRIAIPVMKLTDVVNVAIASLQAGDADDIAIGKTRAFALTLAVET